MNGLITNVGMQDFSNKEGSGERVYVPLFRMVCGKNARGKNVIGKMPEAIC